ncbi:MAG: hypothetical protein IJ580_07475 [Prevotella sp.]|nr:hypothetical protein [Prevotella sp.]MBR1556767.1 hypothetical protein [Prevotella sp.]
MKKYFSLTMSLLAMLTFTACTQEEGTTPGGDSTPYVNIMQYEVSSPLNPDNDVLLRIVANNKASDVYYLAEKTADKDARNMSAEAYADYVISNGTKASLEADQQSGGKVLDVTLTDLFGEYTITAVASNGGAKTYSSTVFTGLDWATVAEGTYQFGVANIISIAGAMTPTTLQVCTTNDKLYRFKDVFGAGQHLKINLLSMKGKDSDGEYTYFRIPAQKTGMQFGSYGDVSIRDVGYWQGDDSWITDNGYESGMYEDYFCFIMAQYYVSAGSLGYSAGSGNNYDFFIPE